MSGRYASVKIGTALIGLLGTWTLSLNRDEIDTSCFGSTWGQSEVGMAKWSASFNGHFDPSDAQQSSIMGSFRTGTLVGELRLYADNSSYWEAASTTQGGGRVTSLEVGADKGGVASISCTFAGSREISYN